LKRILIIDNSIAYTGAFKCAFQEAKLLKDKHQFFFIIPTNAATKPFLAEEGILFFELPMIEIGKSANKLIRYLPSLFLNGLQVRRIIKKNKIDVVQVNDSYNLLGVLARITGYKGKLITYIRLLPSALPTPLRKSWIYLAQRFSDQVICVSETVFKQIPGKKNTAVIYDPVLFEEKLPPKSMDLGSKNFIFLYLANYIPGKGQEHALEAFAMVIKQFPFARIIYTGGDMGLRKNLNYKESLIKTADALGIKKNVEFKTFSEKIEEVIKASDVVLNFSQAESFSMTCLEASYFGVPVIATRCGGPEEIIVDKVTGLLVEKNNIKEMVNAMTYAIQCPKKMFEMGVRARDYVRQKFSVESYLKKIKQTIQ
jgi:L-malate glycosyltransferase